MRAVLSSLVVGLGLVGVPGPGSAASQAASVKKQLLDLTGGRRVKVVWNMGTDKKQTLQLFDTKEGASREFPFAGTAPLLTQDGRRALLTVGEAETARTLVMVDTETRKVSKLASGPGNNVIAVWFDPKTKRDWVYVNDGGDKKQAWDAPCGKIYRFPIDKPNERELFWDRTSSHIYLMFSADGTRACFEPNWSNIGQLSLVYDDKGKVDQDKSTYGQFGGGCFPSMAPDNSYRLFRLDGDHRSIVMCDADNANQRKINITGMLTEAQKSRNCWLTRWSTDPRYFTLVAPAGNDAQIWMGRFDEAVTKVEAWVRVSPEKGPQCWQSHAWIEPERSSGAGTKP
jgi:hypothetical protein